MKWVKCIYSIIFLIFTSSFVYSQEYQIQGTIQNEEQQPVAFAEVFLKNEKDSLIMYDFSDENGKFSLKYQESDEKLTLFIQQFGQVLWKQKIIGKSNENFGAITVTATLKLDEVVVQGTYKIVEQIGDKTVFNVDKSVFAQGNSVDELLAKTPKVTTDGQGGFNIKNKSAQILINGRKMSFSGEDLRAYLATLNSENVKRIEVQESADASQDGATKNGVINIVLKSNPKGFRLISKQSVRYYTRKNQDYYVNESAQYGTDKWYLFAQIYWNNRNQNGKSHTYFFHNDGNRQYSDVDFFNHQNYRIFHGSGMYFINDKSEIGLSATYNKWNNHYHEDYGLRFEKVNADNIASQSKSITKIASENAYFTLNYRLKLDKKGSELKVISDIGNNKCPNLSDVNTHKSTIPTYLNHTLSTSFSNSNYLSLQTDYKQLFDNDWELATGVKVNLIHRENTQDNFKIKQGIPYPNLNRNQDFSNRERISALYASASKKIGKHFLKGGLRVEDTQMSGRNNQTGKQTRHSYIDVFPTLFYKYDFGGDWSANINYRKSISRPSFGDLNPYFFKMNAFQYSEGNPHLKPYYTHTLDVGLDYKKHSLSLTYEKTNDYIRSIYFTNANKVNIIRPVNFGEALIWQANYSYNGNLAKWLFLNLATGVTQSYYRVPEGNFSSFDGYEETLVRITPFENWAIELKHTWVSDFTRFNSSSQSYQYTNIMLEKKSADKKWIFHLQLNDVFNTDETNVINYQKEFYNTFWQKRNSQNLLFSVQYSFDNKQKIKQKDVESGDENRGRL
ncbi:TonB-dependent receptor [Weeksellaceae bacterium TAE3-ERU29]|nr:TonB-dependent receptor [Weeksellaceae bacterium TAE3-ERU29]